MALISIERSAAVEKSSSPEERHGTGHLSTKEIFYFAGDLNERFVEVRLTGIDSFYRATGERKGPYQVYSENEIIEFITAPNPEVIPPEQLGQRSATTSAVYIRQAFNTGYQDTNLSTIVSGITGKIHRYSKQFAEYWFNNPESGLMMQQDDQVGTTISFRVPLTAGYEIDFSLLQTEYPGGVFDFSQVPIGVAIEKQIKTRLEDNFFVLADIDSFAFDFSDPEWYKVEVYVPLTSLESSIPESEREQLAHERALYEQQDQPAAEAADEPIAGPGLSKDQRDNALPLNEQAILLYRIGELMTQNRKKRNEKQYDRFACVECRSNEEIAVLSNHLTSPTDVSALFDRVRPLHLSAVIPRARLFKQYHKDSKRMKGKKLSSDQRTLVEYEFEEHINTDLLSQTLSTNTGIGLESFNWEFNGTNEFESERLINANLKIRAQSIDALETLRRSIDGVQYRFSDLFIADAMQKDNAGNRAANEDYIKYDVKNFETRVSVEYAVDKGSPAFKNPGSEGIAEALEKIKIDINLVVVSHTIDLRDDGTLTVDINFIGRLDATAKDPNRGNILPFKEVSQAQKEKLLKERGDAFAEVDQLEAAMDYLRIRFAGADDKKALKEELALSNKRISELKAKFNLDDESLAARDKYIKGIADSELSKLRLYRSIINGLLTKDAINIVNIDPSNIALTHRLFDPEAVDEQGNLTKEGAEAIMSRGTALQNKFTGELPSTDVLNSVAEISNQFKILSDKMKKNIVPIFQDDAYYIRFFYFGDLMDVVLDNMYNGKYKGLSEAKDSDSSDIDLRTILGPIEIKRNVFDSFQFPGPVKFLKSGKIVVADKYGTFDPKRTREVRVAVDQAQRVLNGTATKKDETLDALSIIPESVFASLADVPISLNLFLRWFAENISNKGSFGYSFKNFLVDATQSLILASLQADSTKILLPKQKRLIRTMTWDAPTDPRKPDAFGFVQVPGESLKIKLPESKRGKAAEVTQLSNIKDKIQKLPLRSGAYMSDYLMVYAETPRYNRKYHGAHKEYQRDLADGIYHLTVGRDVGMVKDISLSAVSIPGYEEMQIQRASKFGNRPTKRVYEASVTMFGTTFFRPGQTVYIHAAAFGSIENLKAFGLCGYYTVRTVSTNFSSGNFETTLVCDFRHGG